MIEHGYVVVYVNYRNEIPHLYETTSAAVNLPDDISGGNSVEDALWLDKDNVAIMGTEEREKVGKVAAVWKYNIPTNSFYQYELQDSVVARRLVGYWRRERLKEVKAKQPEL